jgi:hypothetical protein
LRENKTKKAKRRMFAGAWQLNEGIGYQNLLRSFDNFVRFDAPGAHFHSTVSAARKLDANRLKIRLKPPAGLVISV